MVTYKAPPAPRNIKLVVDDHVIAKAQRGSTTRCLIAMALRKWAETESLDIWSINVTNESVRFNLNHAGLGETGTSRFVYDTPAHAAVLLSQWDEDDQMKVQPFVARLSARSATSRPVFRNGPSRKPYKKRATTGGKSQPRRCKRRHAGQPVVIAGAMGHRAKMPVKKAA